MLRHLPTLLFWKELTTSLNSLNHSSLVIAIACPCASPETCPGEFRDLRGWRVSSRSAIGEVGYGTVSGFICILKCYDYSYSWFYDLVECVVFFLLLIPSAQRNSMSSIHSRSLHNTICLFVVNVHTRETQQ